MICVTDIDLVLKALQKTIIVLLMKPEKYIQKVNSSSVAFYQYNQTGISQMTMYKLTYTWKTSEFANSMT